MPIATAPSIASIRAQFPSLASGFVYLENAGGSQVPYCVADAIKEYMLTSYVQLGAGYPASVVATQTVADAHSFINEFMNGSNTGQVVLGPSSTQLCYMLAECYERALQPGDEIVIAETAHEANAGPWERLASKGFVIRTWRIDPDTYEMPLENLNAVMTDRTKLVAFPHVSNLLGAIVDVARITEYVHSRDAKVVVDGVAYAPHRAIDVKSWNVDWYVYSTYKVFGPHMGALYGTREAFAELSGPNHFFVPASDPYKFELGGVSHEGSAGLLALRKYLRFLSGNDQASYQAVQDAFRVVTDLELPLQKKLMEFLKSKPHVKIIGPEESGEDRVCTISFCHQSRTSSEIAAEVNRQGIGIRYGHMYAYRLCKALGIDTAAGVVRVSAAHYNTVEEIEKLTEVLDRTL